MARQIWNVPCTAHRSSGLPCSAWSIRGGYVCWSHGGATAAAWEAAEFRLWRAGVAERFARELARRIGDYTERLEADRDATLADVSAYLKQIERGFGT